MEFILEVIIQTIFETLPKWIGIGVKWLFYLGKKPIAIIKQENWNTRLGFLVLIILIATIVLIVI